MREWGIGLPPRKPGMNAVIIEHWPICAPYVFGQFSGHGKEKIFKRKKGKMKKSISIIILLVLGLSMLTACIPQIVINTNPATALPVQPSVQPAPSLTPQQPAGAIVKLPKAVFVNTNDGIGLTYVNLQGQTITELKTPGISFPGPRYVHIAGNIPQGPIQIPLVYFAYQPEPALMVNTNDQIVELLKSQNFNGLAGAAGLPVIAFTLLNPKNNNLESKLFVSTLKDIPQAVAVITQSDQNSLSIVPIAVDALGEKINGVWFTKCPWGIGGDIVFDPFGGLYYYDHSNGQVKEILDGTLSFQGISLDRSMAASVNNTNAGQGLIKIFNIKTNTSTSIQLDAGSDRGGGYVEFSPDNRFMAWMEGSGFQMAETPNFHSRIRVAQLGDVPGLVRDVTDSAVVNALGYSLVGRLLPVGWLDNQVLLIEVHQENWENASLVKLDVITGKLSEFSKGSFVGFGYE
jgi:hypothetical protein